MRAFVIRVWAPGDEVEALEPEQDDLRGVVEQIGSTDAAPFRNERELVGWLHERLRERSGLIGGEGERRE